MEMDKPSFISVECSNSGNWIYDTNSKNRNTINATQQQKYILCNQKEKHATMHAQQYFQITLDFWVVVVWFCFVLLMWIGFQARAATTKFGFQAGGNNKIAFIPKDNPKWVHKSILCFQTEREREKSAEESIELVVVFTTNTLNKCFLIIHFRTVRCDQNHRFLKRIDVVVGIDCCCCWHCCCLRWERERKKEMQLN